MRSSSSSAASASSGRTAGKNTVADSPLARSPLLNESSLLFPTTTVPVKPVLKMNRDGTVSPR